MKVVVELDLNPGSPVDSNTTSIAAFLIDLGNGLAQFDTDITKVTHRDKIITELRNHKTGLTHVRARLSNEPFDNEQHDDPQRKSVAIPFGATFRDRNNDH